MAAPGVRIALRAGEMSMNAARPRLQIPRTERLKSVPEVVSRPPSRNPDMKWIPPTKKEGIAPTPVLSGQYLKLYCRSIGDYRVVRARLDKTTTGAFIARRIINGFGLPAAAGRSSVPSASGFVDLTCDAGPGKVYETYRFHILESCPFDVCIGSKPGSFPAN